MKFSIIPARTGRIQSLLAIAVKTLITILVLPAFHLPLYSQASLPRQILQTSSKFHLYYVDINPDIATVYEMGSYLGKAGTGFSIRSVDTLERQAGGGYSGPHSKIIRENGRFALIIGQKKQRKFYLDTIRTIGTAYNNLNNAYYLGHYFEMSNELNRQYPLNHHSFRNGYFTWKELDNKEMDYVEFREFTYRRLKAIRDSIAAAQERFLELTNHIVQHMAIIDYKTLKDSLSILPDGSNSSSRYYSTVVNELARQRPEYFFRLAEDHPQNRGRIFSSVEEDKGTIQGLKEVSGHEAIKKEFFKERRFGKTFPYRIIGTYLVAGGIIALLIAGQ